MNIVKPALHWRTSPSKNPLQLNKVDSIALHHMDHPTAGIFDVEGWHLQRDGGTWKGLGYNFWIGFDGTIYEGRGFNQGAGVLDNKATPQSENATIISIGFQGGYEPSSKFKCNTKMPDVQFDAGVELIKYLRNKIPTIKTIDGHKRWQKTSCPGFYFPLKEMIQKATEVEPVKYQKLYKYNSYVHVIEMNPSDYRLDITEGISGKLEKLSDMFGEPKLDELTWVRMNAQFFGGSDRGYGSFIDPTDNLSDKPHSDGYVDLTYKNRQLAIGTGGDWTIGTSYGLITGGQVKLTYAEWHKKLMESRNPRSMVGCLQSGNNVFAVVDGRWLNLSLGITAEQQIALGQELKFKELASFDGGGSTQLMIGDKIINRPSEGYERPVVSAIMAYRKFTLQELPTLKVGSTGVYVNLLQRHLLAKVYKLGIPDGKFGNLTKSAVIEFQKQKGLNKDGVVGPITWSELIA